MTHCFLGNSLYIFFLFLVYRIFSIRMAHCMSWIRDILCWCLCWFVAHLWCVSFFSSFTYSDKRCNDHFNPLQKKTFAFEALFEVKTNHNNGLFHFHRSRISTNFVVEAFCLNDTNECNGKTLWTFVKYSKEQREGAHRCAYVLLRVSSKHNWKHLYEFCTMVSH